jgi:hypothetical protein
MVDSEAVALLVKLQHAPKEGRGTESTDCRKFNKVSFIRILTDICSAPAGYINTKILVYSLTYSS